MNTDKELDIDSVNIQEIGDTEKLIDDFKKRIDRVNNAIECFNILKQLNILSCQALEKIVYDINTEIIKIKAI